MQPKALKRQIIGYRELVKEQPFNKDIKRKLLEAEGELILAQEHEKETQDKTIQDTVAFLGLKKEELARLMEQFQEMDFDNSGSIDISEFFGYIQVEQTEYNEKVFEWLDSSNDGTLDFSEFLNSIATFCMFGDTELVQQAFTIIDVDGRGYILEDELEDLLDMVHGSNPLPETTVQKALDAFEHSDGRITYSQLSNLHKRQPRLLTPVLNFQAGIRKTFLGVKFWERKLDLYVKTRERMKKELTDKDKKAGDLLKKAKRKKELAEGTATKTWMEIIEEQREKGVIGIYKDARRVAEDTYAAVHSTVTDKDFDAKELALNVMKGLAEGKSNESSTDFFARAKRSSQKNITHC